MIFSLVVAVAVLGAKPTFEEVVKKFPAAKLPMTIDELPTLKLELTADDIEVLGFLKDKSATLKGLRDWKEPPFSGDAVAPGSKHLRPIAAIQRADALMLVVRYEHLEDMFQTYWTFALSYDARGTLLGGGLLHAFNTGEAGAEENVSTLDEAGALSKSITAKIPLYDEAAGDELIVTSEQRGKLTSTGSLEVAPPKWSTRNGLFIDRKSKEELLAIDTKVFYRANNLKPLQQLEGDGKTMRFKNSPKPYVLTWNDRKSEVSCKNPDGRVQVFTREW